MAYDTCYITVRNGKDVTMAYDITPRMRMTPLWHIATLRYKSIRMGKRVTMAYDGFVPGDTNGKGTIMAYDNVYTVCDLERSYYDDIWQCHSTNGEENTMADDNTTVRTGRKPLLKFMR